MPDLGKILDVINRILELVFGKDIPSWLPQLVGIILLAVLVLFAIWGFLVFLSKIMKLWQEDLWPRFYNKERKSHVIRRQHFADHVESEIRRLNNLEVWSDYRFAELEAEVEAEVESRPSGVFRFFKSTQNTLRRERTLSRALAVSKSRLILLEGEPGSGKSVALRHVAQVLARRAMKSRNERAIIPVYINLKELDGPNEQAIDRNLIHAFVLKSLNRVNDRDIEEFLEKEFDQGLREGTWLFLFDSFDEIPEVLGSTESDKVIKSYIDAISDFLHGMNQCRGVVASRQFRGPGKIGWPNFRILPLSEERKLELVRKAEINNQMEKEIIGKLAIADANIFAMTNNPMFLGLLCEHVKHGNPFPENAHTVFESYISARFDRDRERLKKRFTKEVEDIRAVAESVAFCMTADARLGLSPTREKINSSLVKQHFGVDGDLDIFLDALEYTKLARSEKQTPGESQSFTFAHRRFQEYFSTSVVLRDPTRVSAKQLLTNARWRETAVVLLQTQSSHALSPIIKESRSKLKIITEKVEKQIAQAREYIKAISENRNTEKRIVASFPWPQGSIHLISILQDGFSGRMNELPEDIRTNIGNLLFAASETGTISDKRWAIDISGGCQIEVLVLFLLDAVISESQWLKNAAFRQIAKLPEIPDVFAHWILRTLIAMYSTGQLFKEKYATEAHLSRLNKPQRFLSAMRLLLWIRKMDIIIHFISFLILIGFTITVMRLELIIPLWFCFLASVYLVFRLSYSDVANTFIPIISRSILPTLCAGILVRVNPLLAIIGVYCFLWTPLALLAVSAGRFTEKRYWMIIPIWPIILLGQNAKAYSHGLLKFANKIPTLVITVLILVIVMIGWFYLVAQLSNAYPNISVVMLGIFLMVLFFFSLDLPIVLPRNIRRYIAELTDRQLWRKWHQNNQGTTLDFDAFLTLLGKFKQMTIWSTVIGTIRRENLLVATKDAEILVRRLVLDIECSLPIAKLIHASAFSITREIGYHLLRRHVPSQNEYLKELHKVLAMEPGSWLASYIDNDPSRLHGITFELLDETAMLLEYLQAKRREYQSAGDEL